MSLRALRARRRRPPRPPCQKSAETSDDWLGPCAASTGAPRAPTMKAPTIRSRPSSSSSGAGFGRATCDVVAVAWVTVRRSGDGKKRYQGRYRDAAGGAKRTVGTFSTEKAAMRAAVHAEIALAEGTWIDPRSGRITFRDFAERVWLPSRHVEAPLRRVRLEPAHPLHPSSVTAHLRGSCRRPCRSGSTRPVSRARSTARAVRAGRPARSSSTTSCCTRSSPEPRPAGSSRSARARPPTCPRSSPTGTRIGPVPERPSALGRGHTPGGGHRDLRDQGAGRRSALPGWPVRPIGPPLLARAAPWARSACAALSQCMRLAHRCRVGVGGGVELAEADGAPRVPSARGGSFRGHPRPPEVVGHTDVGTPHGHAPTPMLPSPVQDRARPVGATASASTSVAR